MKIKVSVCITSYNRPQKLYRTLESLSIQTRQPDEVIVSDDCSPNDVTEVIRRWQGRFANFIYNRNSRNLGMPGNLNLVISMARGKYIANLHDADEFDPTLLEKWERALDDHPSAGFVFCGVKGWPYRTRFGNGIILHSVAPLTPGRVFFERHMLHRFSSIVWGTVMARRAAYAQLLPFDPAYSFISDVDMWMRMCLHWDVAYVREPLIILDNTPTPWRQFRWDRVELMRKMQVENIYRFYAAQPRRLRRELLRHQIAAQRFYLGRLLGCIRRRDWAGFREGCLHCRNLGWPLRLVGGLARE